MVCRGVRLSQGCPPAWRCSQGLSGKASADSRLECNKGKSRDLDTDAVAEEDRSCYGPTHRRPEAYDPRGHGPDMRRRKALAHGGNGLGIMAVPCGDKELISEPSLQHEKVRAAPIDGAVRIEHEVRL